MKKQFCILTLLFSAITCAPPTGDDTVASTDYTKLKAIVGDELHVFGDSISVGLFADTKASSMTIPNDSQLTIISSDPVAILVAAQNPATQMFQSLLPTLDEGYKKNVSSAFAPTKDDEKYSVASVIGLTAINHATSGDTANKGATPIKSITIPDKTLVILEFGNNDFCQNLDSAQFEIDFKALIEAVKNDQRTILVIPVFNIPKLFDTLKDTESSPKIPALELLSISTGQCQNIRSYMCEYNRTEDDLIDFNSKLKALVKSYNDPKITYVESLESVVFAKKHLAADCFHPSQLGHKVIAEKVLKHLADTYL